MSLPSKAVQLVSLGLLSLPLPLVFSCTRAPILPLDPPVDAGATRRSYHFDAPLVRVWGDGEELWAVGGRERGAVFRFDGMSWTDVTPAGAPPLKAGCGNSSSTLFVVGAALTIYRFADGRWVLEHEAAEDATLQAVTCAAGGAPWAVGRRGPGGLDCVILRRVDGVWHDARPLDLGRGACVDALAGGTTVTIARAFGGLLSYDGTRWRTDPAIKAARQLHRVEGRLLALGQYAVYARSAGWSTLWETGRSRTLVSFAGRSIADLWVTTLESEPQQGALFRFDGQRWAPEMELGGVPGWIWVGERRVCVLLDEGTVMLALPHQGA